MFYGVVKCLLLCLPVPRWYTNGNVKHNPVKYTSDRLQALQQHYKRAGQPECKKDGVLLFALPRTQSTSIVDNHYSNKQIECFLLQTTCAVLADQFDIALVKLLKRSTNAKTPIKNSSLWCSHGWWHGPTWTYLDWLSASITVSWNRFWFWHIPLAD